MSITFAYRALTTGANQFDAWYTENSKEAFNPAGTANKVTSTSNAIGGYVLQNRTFYGVGWNAENIFPNQAFSILVRLNLTTTASLPTGTLFQMSSGQRLKQFQWYLSSGRPVLVVEKPVSSGGNHFSGLINVTATASTIGGADFVITCPGTDGSTIGVYYNGSLLGTETWSGDNGWATTTGWEMFCNVNPVTGTPGAFEEMVIWDEVIDPTNITLVTPGGVTSTAQTLNGPTRTGWVDVKQYEKFSATDPGIANVKSGTNYKIDGNTLTGTLVSTDPGAANVATGVDYIIEGTTYTGSAVLLAAGAGASGTLDINNIKEQIQTILETANTTTASPVDLSANMALERVKTIKKVNPDKIPSQLSLFPMVTVWIDGKSIDHATIAKNQRTGKRRAEVDVKVMGIVFNNNISTDDEDPADEDINYLMENIELTLRAFPKLGGNGVITSIADRVDYYRDYLNTEQTHVRAGVLDLKVTTYY